MYKETERSRARRAHNVHDSDLRHLLTPDPYPYHNTVYTYYIHTYMYVYVIPAAIESVERRPTNQSHSHSSIYI